MAHMLLVKKIETNVCIFEKENRLGGKIYDHFFPEAPGVSVGEFSVKKGKKNCLCVSVVGKCYFAVSQFFCTIQKRQGMNHSLDCCICFILRAMGQE